MNARTHYEAMAREAALPNDEYGESPELICRHVIADVLSARNAHRTGLRLRKQHGTQWADQAFALRDAAMRGARRNLAKYHAALARAGGAA